MLRICLCLLFAIASATVAAREAKLESPASGGGCPDKHGVEEKTTARATITRGTVPARQTKAKPTVHSDAPSGHLQSPRWHSFLPGMFR